MCALVFRNRFHPNEAEQLLESHELLLQIAPPLRVPPGAPSRQQIPWEYKARRRVEAVIHSRRRCTDRTNSTLNY